MEEFERIYPEKPVLTEKKIKNSFPMTIFSIILFVWAFFTFVSTDWRFITIIVGVLLFHESGHFFTMKFFKYKVVKMLFIPLLGAIVQGEKDTYSQRERAIVLLAGPIPGVIMGVLLMYWSGEHHNFWGMYAGLLLVVINALNLLPIDPLDGGQLTQVLFFDRQELYQLVFAFASSIIMIFVGLYFNNWLLIAFGFILGVRVRSFQKLYHIRKDLKEEQIEFSKNYKDLSNKEYHQIKHVFLKHSPSATKIVEHSMIEEEVVEELISNEVNNILETPTLKDINWIWKSFFIFLWLVAISASAWIIFTEFTNLSWFIDAFKIWR
jgi:Zn-dependent protease